MGVVYLGRDPVIGRLVALKTIRVTAEDDLEQREFSERFLREAQAAGTLSHPNIVTIHDVGEEEETSFIAMEYVEGKNLKQIIRDKESLSWDRIAEIIAQVAEALDYAHRKGIVHRDVKPANIIITSDGAVKITDFGIAKIETSSLTETGQFLGTPNYMSPEQVTGEAVDGRSDLFSLGVVLYELLTRKKPFLGDNVTSISYKIVHEDFPSLHAVDRKIPADFLPVLSRALSKDPAARFQRGADFAQALSELRARQAEYQMIKDLGEMVAQAEKLGPVATVEAPSAPAAAHRAAGLERTVPVAGAPPGAPLDVTAPLEALARRRDDLNPQLVSAPARVDSSGPDWSLDTDALKRPGARASAPAEPPPREPVPSSPGTMITDIPKVRKPAGGDTKPAAAVIPTLDVSALPKPEPDAAARRPAPVTPPALPDGAGPGPRPPALPVEATGPIRRPARIPPPPVPAAAPAPAPKERTAPVRLESPAAPLPRDRTGPTKLEAPPAPPTKDRTGPTKLEPPAGGMPKERPAAPRAETAPVAATEAGVPPAGPEDVLRRDIRLRWVAVVLAVALLPTLFAIGLLFTRSRRIVPKGEGESAAARSAVTAKRRLLDEGKSFLVRGELQEAKARFLELARIAPESAAAKDGLEKTERLLAAKAERDRQSAEVARHLSAAKAAREGDDPAGTLAAAEAALLLEPENAEALSLKREASGRMKGLSAGERRRAEARLKSLRASAVATPAAPRAAAPLPAGAGTVAGGPPLHVRFRSPFASGTLFVKMNGAEVLRRSFDFAGRAGGTVEANVEVPAAGGELAAWVFSADGRVREYASLKADIGAGGRSLVLGLERGRKLSLTLE